MSTSKTQKKNLENNKFLLMEDDITLCEAYLAITVDGNVSVCQNKNLYWNRIFSLFIDKINENPNGRDKESLENGICTIRKDIK